MPVEAEEFDSLAVDRVARRFSDADLGGGAFFASSRRMVSNMAALTRAASVAYGGNVRSGYSVKTNYLRRFVRAAHDAGALIEVVSAHEYELARSIGIPPTDIVLNGPGKTPDLLERAIAASSMINLDSVEEMELVAAMSERERREITIGVRIAATLSNGEQSRFGMHLDDGDAVSRVRKIVRESRVRVAGLHVHHSSERSAQSFADRVRLLAKATAALGLDPEALRWIDVGGGFASHPPVAIRNALSYPIDRPEAYAEAIARGIREHFGTTRATLILEPGIGVLADTMVYVSQITAFKRSGGRLMLISNGSMFEVNPLRSRISPPSYLVRGPLHESPEPFSAPVKATVYGSTCMEIDQLGEVEATFEPRAGDLIVTTNVGAYSLSLSPDFIYAQAPVICADTGATLRPRRDLGNFSGAGA